MFLWTFAVIISFLRFHLRILLINYTTLLLLATVFVSNFGVLALIRLTSC